MRQRLQKAHVLMIALTVSTVRCSSIPEYRLLLVPQMFAVIKMLVLRELNLNGPHPGVQPRSQWVDLIEWGFWLLFIHRRLLCRCPVGASLLC